MQIQDKKVLRQKEFHDVSQMLAKQLGFESSSRLGSCAAADFFPVTSLKRCGRAVRNIFVARNGPSFCAECLD